ncbi:MAG: sugar ABC transporter permease [Dehalococcoidales bacterium]|nr:sugar ABC transporter permease [Dehalococcoidales bacterium]
MQTGETPGTKAIGTPASPAKAVPWAVKRRRTFIYFLAPAMILLFIVTILPTIYLIATSFTPLDLTKPKSLYFSGLTNYQQLLKDDRFWNSLWVQARLSFWTVTLQMLLGLGLAVLLNARLKFLEFLRSAFILPMVLPPVVVALTWKILFTPNVSILNYTLGLLHLPQPAWLADGNLALWAIIIADVWEWFPFVLLMLLAGLQMMPEEPLEAARIDGASGLQIFRHITLPLLRPVLLVAALFRLIDSIKAFPHIYIMTGGGPGVATEATNYYSYLEAFSYTYIGFSSAIITVMLAVAFGLSVGVIRAVGQEVEVE